MCFKKDQRLVLYFTIFTVINYLFLIIGNWIMPRLPWPNIMLRTLKTKLQLNVYNYMEDGDLWWKPQLQGKLKMMFLYNLLYYFLLFIHFFLNLGLMLMPGFKVSMEELMKLWKTWLLEPSLLSRADNNWTYFSKKNLRDR